ncbi:hypothetical protein HMPREF9184_01742 [Streptococcus sp. oral taxon 058 str. F0407]|nr:hypothetical protein HMPREF9184_01742 [Streptococcus sp. oral taxon 058 str. F0407]
MIGIRIFLQAEECYFWYNRWKKMRLEEMIFDTYLECLEYSLSTLNIIEAQINHKTNQRKVKVA